MKSDSQEPIRAEILRLELRPWPPVVRSQGSLVADEVTTVGAKLAGRVAAVHVDLGDHVERDAQLVRLDRNDLVLKVQQVRAQLDQARAALGLVTGQPAESLDPDQAPPVREAKAIWSESKATASRLQLLRNQQSVTEAQLDQADSAERVAEARYASALNSVREKIALIQVKSVELALANQEAEDALSLAPYEGYVQSRLIAPGSYVQAGQPLITIVRTGTLRFRGTLPERYAQQVAVGQFVSINVESVSKPLQVQITRISPALDEATRSLTFEADVENSDGTFRPGLFAEAQLTLNADHTAILVPASAVVEFAGAEKVWKVVDGRAVEQPVKVGRRNDTEYEIREGLSAGDQILIQADMGRLALVDAVSRHATQSN
ncbi:MAG: efflux RND transporter periplasmic adaptor subunit [Planctomycetota bacterium]|nr:efflux RND transporter periplasmic adaptor subunit [Planctomycetota bacterium]MDA1178967.1 efflux RND transporter periplasmic adaptor subunit [Planctomycetota bacterium]